ncbi:MAG: 1-acyl-sn-glycerol-3-phosphate acyltransferase [Phycisphaerae bacterium]|nr:1-acyl-sn-glycerol-3-phosphate acyltransferase [Phycisphaerae bacterium]
MDNAPARTSSLAQRLFYWTCWTVCLVILTFFYRLRRFNTDRIPRHGPVLIAANHQSHFDPPAIGMCNTSRPTHFIARAGLFTNRAFAWLISAVNALPIKEDSGDLGAIREVLARLETGVPVLIFPEGSRTPDGEIHEFKRGVALLLKRARCPVVPVAIEGAYQAFPRTRTLPRLVGQRIAVMVGRPIPHEELLQHGPEAGLARLRSEIESMRAELRSKLRATTSRNRLPPPVRAPVEMDAPGGS